MSFPHIPLIAVDAETTGVDVETAEVWELGAARRIPGTVAQSWSRILRPSEPILSAEVREVCQIDDALQAQICEAQPMDIAVAGRLYHWADQALGGRCILLTFNGLDFDWPILTRECARVDVALPQPPDLPLLDVCIWVRARLRHLQRRQLGAVLAHLRPGYQHTAHRAAGDALATIELATAMLDDGLVPTDLDTLLAWQAEQYEDQRVQFGLYGYHMYIDASGVGCMGFGKHCGAPLAEVGGYCAWALRTMGSEMTEATRAAFGRAAGAARRGR